MDAPFGLYPVSLLKPLKGSDPSLSENLESFFHLDYPDYELIFSVASVEDPAIAVVRALMRQHSKVRATLVVGEAQVGSNPKVNNLAHAYDWAKHDLVLISDSNVRVAPDYLKRLIAHMDNDVGIVTSLVEGAEGQGFGASLERDHLNVFVTRGMLIAAGAAKPCVMGKSMLFRRSVANRFGGIKALGRYLAEDFMAGEAMRHLGLKVVVARDSVQQYLGPRSMRDFWLRQVRWGRIRKSQSPPIFLAELILQPLVVALYGSFFLAPILGLSWIQFLVTHLAVAWWIDSIVSQVHGRGRITTQPIIWLMREVLCVPLWFTVAMGNTVEWRGKKLVLEEGGLLEHSSHA